MLNRRVLPDFVLLRTPPGHTAAAAVAFHAIGSAVAAHARAAEIRAVAAKAIVVVIAAWRRDAGAVHSRIAIANAVVTADEAMIAVVATVWRHRCDSRLGVRRRDHSCRR